MGEERSDLQLRRLSLIDFSSENDALVFSTSSPLRSQIAENGMQPGLFESFGEPLSCGEEMGLSLTPDGDQGNQFPDLMKSAEPDRSSWKTKCNLRKSLAWDNAFFTSAGVLDAEELSCIMEGAEKSEKKFLPGIEEDIRESSDSASTLESDNLVLENLEAELFQDIRASIQRSSKSYAATSEQANLGESKTISSKKKIILSSQNQKHTPDSKKPIGAPKPPARQTPRAPGIAKSVNEGARRPKVEQPVRPGNSNPTLKPPRVISTLKPTTTPTAKRASFAASDVNKMGLHNMTTVSAAGKVPPTSKVPIVSSARRVLPRPTLPSKTSSFGSSNSTKSAASSLTDSSGSVSTEKMSKPNLVLAQRKVGGKAANSPAASSSSLKTPSKSASRNMTTSRNSAVSAYLMSSKISSSMSPASSNNELSSASSSSSVTFLRSKSRTSFDTSSCRSSQNDRMSSDWNAPHSSQMLDKDANEGMAVPSRSARKSSTQTGSISSSDSARPSGLRLPSPKIGHFDAAKSTRTPTGSRQSHSHPAVLPKAGAVVPSPRRISNVKPKSLKTSHAKAVSALPKMNSQATSPMPIGKAQTPQEHDHSGTSDVGGQSTPSSLDLKYDEEGQEKVEGVGGEVPDQANHVESAGIEVVIKRDDLSLMRKSETTPDVNEAVNLLGNKAVAVGDLYGCDSQKREILKPREKVDEDDKAIGGTSLVDAATSSKDNMVAAIGDTSNSEKREISKPLENVDKDGPENFAMPSVLSVDEKENVVFREYVDEFGNIPGH